MTQSTNGTIVVSGAIAQRPARAGHSWVFLQYLLGLRRLGWDVLFLDRLEPEACVDAVGRPCPVERSVNLQYLDDLMRRFDLAGSYSVVCEGGRYHLGLPRDVVAARLEKSAFLLNVMGFLTDEELLGLAPRRVFLDIDPGFGQMWCDLGLHDLFAGHDDFVTIGQNIGLPSCDIPTCGLSWVTTPQPVVLDEWPSAPPSYSPAGDRFTSIVTWRGVFDVLEHGGRTYGLRAHQFRRFARLPERSGVPFELALDIHAADERDRALLTGHGWQLADPLVVACDTDAYRAYIQASTAEFLVAKGIYVETRSGWVSDRSICYLASGRPVVAQDTDLGHLYPLGEGLVTFADLDEAVVAVEEVWGNRDRHRRAARALAEDVFDSDKVLGRLLGALGVA